MRILQKLLNKFNGLHYTQEYLCFAKESFLQPLHVYLVNGKHIIKDITNQHLFVGYCPLVFAFSNADLPGSVQLIFSHKLLLPNETYSKKDAIASLDLKIIKEQAGGWEVSYYEGTRGSHHFLSTFHQFINSLYNQWYNKKPGNVFLHDNLYKQVQIAYAVPRIISLITVGNNELFNLFPTDLHGQVDEAHYIISLRIGGKACEQVEKAGKVLLSRVHSDAYKMVYGLGKNHMQELKPKDNFPFSRSLSENFKWPLPEQVLSYQELVLQDSFTHGIHKIMLFKIVFHQQLQVQNATLAHIHNSYATWRYKNGLPGNYLLR
ncbi:MAG: hypothetical protein ABI666_05640 [Ferruginibacter sp.]